MDCSPGWVLTFPFFCDVGGRWDGWMWLTWVVVVDHYRVLWNFVRVILEKDENGTTICNRSTCPKMSAGR